MLTASAGSLPAQVDELAFEPLVHLVQALVDGAARTDPLQLPQQLHHALHSARRIRTFGTAATASSRSPAMKLSPARRPVANKN